MTKTFCRLKSCLPEWEEAVLVSPDMGGAKRFHHHHVMILVSFDMGKTKRFFHCVPIQMQITTSWGHFLYVALFSGNFKINIIITARCAGLASKLSLDFALMHKERVKAGEISRMILVIINIVILSLLDANIDHKDDPGDH